MILSLRAGPVSGLPVSLWSERIYGCLHLNLVPNQKSFWLNLAMGREMTRV